ncbi:MAG: SDR family NAD(P)-dependent oxidoreductase [Planctomycetes bacterium]|nr:SDR family NAD(P)-dependent oxidoreductase [Planctomycetota bacterium]
MPGLHAPHPRRSLRRREGLCSAQAPLGGTDNRQGYSNQAAYTASKHAIMGLTKSLAAKAHEHGIRVSAILPGGVDRELIAGARPDLDCTKLLEPEHRADGAFARNARRASRGEGRYRPPASPG